MSQPSIPITTKEFRNGIQSLVDAIDRITVELKKMNKTSHVVYNENLSDETKEVKNNWKQEGTD